MHDLPKNEITWEKFVSTMTNFFGSAVAVRETQVKFMNCRQTHSVSEFVKSQRAFVRLLSGTSLEPSSGNLIAHFIDGLDEEPRKRVLQQAPAETWYVNPKDVYMKALQWEINAKQERAACEGARLNFHQKGRSAGNGTPRTHQSGKHRRFSGPKKRKYGNVGNAVANVANAGGNVAGPSREAANPGVSAKEQLRR